MKIEIPTTLRNYAGNQSSIHVKAETVSAAVTTLLDQYPDFKKHLYTPDGKLRSFVNLYLNDEDVRYLPEREETVVKDSDTLSIIPSIAGGCWPHGRTRFAQEQPVEAVKTWPHGRTRFAPGQTRFAKEQPVEADETWPHGRTRFAHGQTRFAHGQPVEAVETGPHGRTRLAHGQTRFAQEQPVEAVETWPHGRTRLRRKNWPSRVPRLRRYCRTGGRASGAIPLTT